jgi:hypothetical protein
MPSSERRDQLRSTRSGRYTLAYELGGIGVTPEVARIEKLTVRCEMLG